MAMKRLGLSLAGQNITDKIALAQKAEDAGFEVVWVNDDPGQDTFVSLSLMAAATKRIHVGSGVCRAFIRHPIVTASAASDINEFSGGRMRLGFSTGTKGQNRMIGLDGDHAGSRLREVITVMRQQWHAEATGEPVHFEGKYYNVVQPAVRAANRLRRPGMTNSANYGTPVYLAAVNPYMLQVAGELCEGLAGHPASSVGHITSIVLPNLEIGLKKAGRERSSFDLGNWIICSIAADRTQARREAARQIGFYCATRSYAVLLDCNGFQEEREAIQHAYFELHDMEKVADAVTDRVIDALSVAGTADEVRSGLKRYEGLVDLPSLYAPGTGLPVSRRKEIIESIIETFAPANLA